LIRRLIVLLLALLTLTALHGYPDTDRGVGTLEKPAKVEFRIGKQYLVVIAINKYQHWMPLLSPVRDAQKLEEVLISRYHIDEVYELYDDLATKANIIKLFVDLQKKLKSDDSLLVIYSGHGHLDENSDTGFWIPVNAGTDIYEQQNWLPHVQLRGLIANIEATHVLVISDSCFAGNLIYSTRSLPVNVTAEYFKGAYSRVSRQVLTSGAVEVVPDRSAFADQLISVFKRNDHSVLDALMLFNEVRLGVKGSTPLLGALAGTGHQEGASFLLFLNDEAVSPDSPESVPGTTPAALPFPSGGAEVGPGNTGTKRSRHLSAGISYGWMITVGEFGQAFQTGPSPSGRLYYLLHRERGEVGVGLRTGALILTGRDDSSNPLNPDPWDLTCWPVAASFSYTAFIDPPLYLTAELEAGAAINSIKTYSPELHTTITAKPYLGSAIGVGLRFLDSVKITFFGRFVSTYFDIGLYMGLSPEFAIEYAF